MVNVKGVVDTARPLVCLAKFKVYDNKSIDSCVSLCFSMEANGLWIRNFTTQWRHSNNQKGGFYWISFTSFYKIYAHFYFKLTILIYISLD